MNLSGGNPAEMTLRAPAGLQLISSRGELMVSGEVVVAEPLSTGLPQPDYTIAQHGQVMTDEQLETLRRQISVYATICHQLVEMHKASVSQQSPFAGFVLGQHLPYDQVLGAHRTTSRQRWTPSQSQLQILERLFDQGNGTPNKQRIKEITSELGQHGQISETNVYNWFQNRKARAKRKQQQVVHRDGESEADTDVESPKDKKNRLDSSRENSGSGHADTSGQCSPGVLGILDQDPYTAHSQVDVALNASLCRGTAFDHDYGSSGGHHDTGFCTIIIHGKPWKILSGVVDVRNTFGETAFLLDSQGLLYPTDEAGVTLQPLLAGESYIVAGLGESMSMSGQHISDSFHNNFHKVVAYQTV
ncbi:hypothetical protein O6H91_08G067200 [Diphasiastrum complanatum]|uniref:Uncharacterized protein n=2 Tax=Diphasiastrum complanatum TaxID=34168 RepID=A0ACC2CYI3_DIPCM|nr:hypothetical protein O6H91_08G067200 [Diphasiastrum complanatum]